MADDLKPWTVMASKTILKDKWIDLTAQTCVTPKGEAIAPFYLFAPRPWCAILAIDTRDHAIMVRQYRHGIAAMSLELPGGVIEETNADPAVAAARELAEETGYHCGAIQPAGRFAANPHNQTNFMHVFLARGVVRSGDPKPDFGEAVVVERHPIGALGGLITSGAIVHGLHIAALTLALAVIGR
jgi:8-oxo-dGTP pyrophosphatase MutT (NUDIX family)